MNKKYIDYALILVSALFISLGICFSFLNAHNIDNNIEENLIANIEFSELVVEPEKEEPTIVYDGLTFEELAAKLDRILNSDLEGMGTLYASKSLELGVDPYLAVAISLHETGCMWTCSQMVQVCNNVGGQKGPGGCFGGSYAKFSTLDAGIDAFITNLYNNYYANGLTTVSTIAPRYAESKTWESKINYYINLIRAS